MGGKVFRGAATAAMFVALTFAHSAARGAEETTSPASNSSSGVSAPNTVSDRPVSRIAFGSCARQDRPQPVWNTMLRKQLPDVFVFLGDNIYGDTTNTNVMRRKYERLAAQPGFEALRGRIPMIGTWDDHDYGENDAGAEFSMKVEMQKEFHDFFQTPEDSPRRAQPGVYHAWTYGAPGQRVQVIALDTRYFRSKLKRDKNWPPPAGTPRRAGGGPYLEDASPKATMLGEEQWAWLERTLREPADLRIIASSIQLLSEDHGWERWATMPAERARLYRLIKETSATGVVVVSGDRHLGDISVAVPEEVGYPIYDITSSGMTQSSPRWRLPEPNRHRVSGVPYGNNYGEISVDWADTSGPLVRMMLRDTDGEILAQQRVRLSLLSAEGFKDGTPAGAVAAQNAATGDGRKPARRNRARR